jgi:hypothetical protein
MRHEPSGLEGNAKGAVKLVTADALLAANHQVDRLHPDVHRDVAAIEDSPDLHGEGLAADVALIDACAGALALHFAHALTLATLRAGRAMRPDACLYESVGRFFVVKVGRGKMGYDVPFTLRDRLGYVKYKIAFGWRAAFRSLLRVCLLGFGL